MLFFKAIGVSLLWVMAALPHVWKEHPVWLAALYITRSALINCVVPLSRSILMDYVRPDQRYAHDLLLPKGKLACLLAEDV